MGSHFEKIVVDASLIIGSGLTMAIAIFAYQHLLG